MKHPRYNRKDFDYHSQLLNGDNTLSTNPIENQNHQLKISMGAGRLPFHDRLNHLPEFCIRLGFLNKDFCDAKYLEEFSEK